ncbi:MAG: hypothetical protein HQL46_04765 [Gammaproteobacteria bacterium]|nr:hypothetical protein [Gammaproteobacteria bacterium]
MRKTTKKATKKSKLLDFQALKLSELNAVLDFQLKALTEEETKACVDKILQFLNEPVIESYKLSVIANKLMVISADYDDYVSVSIFKALPDNFTLIQLQKLQEQLYQYISDFVIGSDLDQAFSQVLIEETQKKYLDLKQEQARQKALGNWGWLLPHALMQLIIEQVNEIIKQATLDNKKKNRKGRIRIKKM